MPSPSPRPAYRDQRHVAGRRPLRALLLLAASVAAPAGALAQTLPAREARARLLAAADARRMDRPALARLSSHADAGVRAEVARLLGHLASPRGVSLLERLVTDKEGEVRAAVAEAAGRLYPDLVMGDGARDRLEQLLHRLFGDRDPRVRAAAAWGMGRARIDHLARYLVSRLQHESDASVKAAALRELWRAEGADWVGVAAASLSDADPAVRFAAAWSLARSEAAPVAAPLRLAARDPQGVVRAAALSGAQRGHGKALWDELCAGTEDGEARVRIAALAGLAAALDGEAKRSLPDAVEKRVVARVEDADPEAVHERVAAIRVAGVARLAEAELRALARGGEPWLSGEALIAYAHSGRKDAGALVRTYLDASEPATRTAGARAARYLADGTATLVALLDDASPVVRLTATEELVATKSPEAVPALRKRFADEDPAVRAAAIEGCTALGAPPRAELPLELLANEKGQAIPDAAVALIAALAERAELDPKIREELKGLTRDADPVIARAAWAALRRHRGHEPLPPVATGKPPSFYRDVLEWASRQRWLEIVTIRGTMQVKLDTQRTPLAAYRLSELASAKFFDNLTVHRVVPNFVVQGGDPRGDGWGGPGFVVRDELSLLPFDAGAVGVALAGPDTGGSQLFVTLTPQPHLLGRYPRIGEVIAGTEVGTRLRRGDRIVRVRAGEGALPTFYPVWYGPLTPERLDAGISGWREERERYTPNAELLETLATAKLRYEITAAVGTWCSDSREQIPRLQAVLAALGARSPFEPLRLLGTDRTKQPSASQWRFGEVELSPTIVVSLGGSEVGRIVETPTSGSIEGDLVRTLAPLEGWGVSE